jgi:uncharacterized protein YfaS (alpha-2-macroglobulin family)
MGSRLFLTFLTFVGCFVFSSTGFAAETILTFTPQGKVKPIRQVRVQFSAPMIAFGNPKESSKEVAEPFKISCAAHGTARWADAKNWIYDFDEDLKAGVECKFALSDTLKTLNGKSIEGKQEYSFSSGDPAVQLILPRVSEWNQIEEDQAFVLLFDGTVNGQSTLPKILERAYFSISGIQEQVPLKVLTGADREAAIKVQTYEWEILEKNNDERVVVIQSSRKFPYDAKLTLVLNESAGPSATQKYEYKVRKDFSVTFTCTRMTPEGPCVPFHEMGLHFTSSVAVEDLKQIVLRTSDGKRFSPHLDLGSDGDPHLSYIGFKGPFEENKKYHVELPSGLKDEMGRPLVNGKEFPLQVTTDQFPPLAKFASDFGILEWNAESAEAILPVTIRKVETDRLLRGRMLRISDPSEIETFAKWMGKVSKQVSGEDRGVSVFATGVEGTKLGERFEIPKTENPDQTEVVGIPIKKPGLYIVEVESKVLGEALLGAHRSMFVSTAVLVTDTGVHFKRGTESSLVWVTSLKDGKPKANALVSIQDCTGKLLNQSRTNAEGVARFKVIPATTASCNAENYSPYKHGLYATVVKDGDFSMAHSGWDRGIEPWRFNLDTYSSDSSMIPHVVMDRTLLRAGDTLHMKMFFRKHGEQGISLIPVSELPKVLILEGMGQSYESEIRWASNGTAEYNWTVPKGARLGMYSVIFKKNKTSTQYSDRTQVGSFNVEEFRVPLMKGTIRPPSGVLVSPREIPVDLSVAYLSGGGASKHPVSFRYSQRSSQFRTFEDFEGFYFAWDKVRVGNQKERAEPESQLSQKHALTLDATGGLRFPISNLKEFTGISDLSMELEFSDPNGETQTTSSRLSVYSSKRLIGIKELHSWHQGAGKVELAVVDIEGKPIAHSPVELNLFKKIYYSHRKRVVGGFYSYENRDEIKDLGQVCKGETDSKGRFVCEVDPKDSGTFTLEGRTQDEDGNPSYANTQFSAYGPGTYFAQQDDDRIDVIPEKKTYEIGEKAKFQVQLPFRDATALVTVEREGVMDSYVMPVSSSQPTIEIPIKKNYAPNVFVSVLAIRGRVSDPKATAVVDLGKPAFKLGIGKINVGWKAHELKASVSAERAVYQVRDKARVKVKVQTGFGKAPYKGEVIFAAVDEALLLLKSNDSWNLLEAMMKNRPYEFQTYTSQMEVVGKRHFGMKAVASGGGGGESPTRELFDTLLFWSAKVALDAKGEAVVTVPLNDSISSFRLVAVAHAGSDQFGKGMTTLRTMQDLVVASGVPPVIREGDRFPAEFTLRNSTATAMEIEVHGKVTQDKAPAKPLASQRVQLSPGASTIVKWETVVPTGASVLTYEVEAKEIESLVANRKLASDRLRVTQKVTPAIPVRTYQATLEQLDGAYELMVKKPETALAGRGGLTVTLQPTIAGGLAGVTEYMKRYPYSCLEQKVSKAVSLHDKAAWTGLMEQLPTYLDNDGLAKFFPVLSLSGSETLTAYLLTAASESGMEIPEAPRLKMLGGLKKFVEGSVSRSAVGHRSDLTLRKLAAMEALARYGQLKEGLIATLEGAPPLWPTSAVLHWFNILQRVKGVPTGEPLKDARQTLMSRLNFQATQLTFSTEETDRAAGIFSEPEINLNRLILALASEGENSADRPASVVQAQRDDLARLIRGALGRQSQGHWQTTPGNVWGVLAFEKFSQLFEKEAVSGKTQVSLGESKNSFVWPLSTALTAGVGSPTGSSLGFEKTRGKVFDFEWPVGEKALSLRHEGKGKPWLTVQSKAAMPLTQPISSGFKIERKIIPVEVKKSGEYHKGDILRIQLDLEAQSDESWVVVEDPIPAGSMILGSGLGNDSAMATESEKRQGAWPIFEERSFEGFRAYYESISKGKWSFQYTLRLNQSGVMNLPPTRVEAMYSPEAMGENPNGIFKVLE